MRNENTLCRHDINASLHLFLFPGATSRLQKQKVNSCNSRESMSPTQIKALGYPSPCDQPGLEMFSYQLSKASAHSMGARSCGPYSSIRCQPLSTKYQTSRNHSQNTPVEKEEGADPPGQRQILRISPGEPWTATARGGV